MINFETIWNLIFLTTAWCCGVYLNRDKGDVFWFLNKWTENWGWIGKPIIQCVNCMASLHSILVMTIYFQFYDLAARGSQLIALWLIVTISSSFTNGLAFLLYVYLSRYIQTYLDDKNDDYDTK